ncbi:hypothetical protein C8R44DRAFT_763944 [Mycena epipterygia]|nr:hypothetical protein C8R44DRAFT_763944 [Mycena epipterygia]
MFKTTLCLLAVLTLSTRGERSAVQISWDSRHPNRPISQIPESVSPTNFGGCDATQKAQLVQAFKDAGVLASKGITIDFNMMAALEFLGAPGYIGPSHRKIIQDNFARAAAYQPRWDDRFRNMYVNLTCNDPAALCADNPTTSVYHLNPEPKQYPVLNFCPLFFTQRSLDEAMRYAADPERAVWDLTNYDQNQGLIFLHEIMHIDAVGQPPITDLNTTYPKGREIPAMGPKYCKYLGRQRLGDSVEYASRNADSYAQYAMAIYVQEKTGYYPHEPVVLE